MYAIPSANVCGKKKMAIFPTMASTPYFSLDLAIQPCNHANLGFARRPTARLKLIFLAKFFWTVSGSEIFSSNYSSINSQNVTTNTQHLLNSFSSRLLFRPQAHHSLGKESTPLPSQLENTLPFLFPCCFSVGSPFLLMSVVSAHSTAPLADRRTSAIMNFKSDGKNNQ